MADELCGGVLKGRQVKRRLNELRFGLHPLLQGLEDVLVICSEESTETVIDQGKILTGTTKPFMKHTCWTKIHTLRYKINK